MGITIRRAQRSDANRINELFVEMLQTIYNTKDVDGYEEGFLDRYFAGTDEIINVAVDGDEVIAFLSIQVYHEDTDYIYFDDFSVSEKFRGKGLGTTLIKMAEDYALEIGISEISLHVEKSNEAALRLYERLGYRISEDQGNRFLMVKNVNL